MSQHPTYCSRGADHPAAWIVTGRRVAATACPKHLAAIRRSIGEPAELEPVKQPPGHDPPDEGEQQTLF